MNVIDEMITDIEGLVDILHGYRNKVRQNGINFPPLVLQGLRDHLKNLKILNEKVDLQEQVIEQQQALITFMVHRELPANRYARMQLFLDYFVETLGTKRGAIIANNPDHSLHANIHVQTPEFDVLSGGNYDEYIIQKIIKQAIKEGKAYSTDNGTHDDRLSGGKVVNFALYTIFVIPIIQNDEIRAFVYLDNHLREGLFNEEACNACVAIAEYMSQKIIF